MAKLITEESMQATLKLIADDIKTKSNEEHVHGYEDIEDLTTESDIDAIWGTEEGDGEINLTANSLTLGKYKFEFDENNETLDIKFTG